MKSGMGKAVKVIAVIIGILGVIAAFGTAAMNGVQFNIAVFIVTVAVSLILSVVLYGFGEMMENTRQIKQAIFELNSNMHELEVRLKAKLDDRPAAPAKKADAPNVAEVQRKEQSDALDKAIAPYEKLNSAEEIYKHFRANHPDDSDEDIAACADRLEKVAYREKEGNGNSKNNALSLLKSFYKHGCRIYAVDRSGATFRCPACNNKIFSDRRSCHHCGALFRV
ncbi:MAG: hypothetical protein IJA26_01095 [Clostridia bacterium]|nr:hypothetical protein [Clostridia bacterium]